MHLLDHDALLMQPSLYPTRPNKTLAQFNFSRMYPIPPCRKESFYTLRRQISIVLGWPQIDRRPYTIHRMRYQIFRVDNFPCLCEPCINFFDRRVIHPCMSHLLPSTPACIEHHQVRLSTLSCSLNLAISTFLCCMFFLAGSSS